MARPLRIEIPGGLYHVTSRGDRQEDIYGCDEDRVAWLNVLSEVCTRFRWICHVWCQMTNHYHIVVETIEGNLSSGMRHLNGVYTQSFKHRHGRVGHVFQGRYKAILVERDSYLMELARYVVRNPVRAYLVSEPGAWPWTSYGSMIGTAPSPPWLHTESILGHFADTRRRAIARYVEFVRAGATAPSIWTHLRGQIYLGSDAFLERLRQPPTDEALREIPRTQRHPFAYPIEHYRCTYADRRSAMAAAFASGDYSMREIADAFGVHYTTVSRSVRQVRESSDASPTPIGQSKMRECKT
jgi:putative transposase